MLTNVSNYSCIPLASLVHLHYMGGGGGEGGHE